MTHSTRSRSFAVQASRLDDTFKWLARGLAMVVLAIALVVGSIATAQARDGARSSGNVVQEAAQVASQML